MTRGEFWACMFGLVVLVGVLIAGPLALAGACAEVGR